jgi:AcrR family transcriptional regulator
MKRTKEDAALTHQVVLDAALKVFSRKGYNQATLEAVAREAGLTRGAIYWHFGSKFEMFRAVLKALYEKTWARVMKTLDSEEKPLIKIRRLMAEFFLVISNQEESRVIEEVQIFKFEKKKELKELFDSHQENMKILGGVVKDLIREGISAGEIDPGLDPDIAALALIGYMAGMKSAWLSGIADISIIENAGMLAEIFINGITRGDSY